MNDGTENQDEKRKPVMVLEAIHAEVKVKAARLKKNMQDAADEMATDWLRKPAKKGK